MKFSTKFLQTRKKKTAPARLLPEEHCNIVTTGHHIHTAESYSQKFYKKLYKSCQGNPKKTYTKEVTK